MPQDFHINGEVSSANGFNIADVDLSVINNSNALLLLLQQVGADGAISGVVNNNNADATTYSNTEKNITRAILNTVSQLSMQQSGDAFGIFFKQPEQNILFAQNTLDHLDAVTDIRENQIEALVENGDLSETEGQEYLLRTGEIRSKIDELRLRLNEDLEEASVLSARARNIIATTSERSPEIEGKLLSLLASGGTIVTIEHQNPDDELPQRYIVFQEEDGRYYFENSGTRQYIDPSTEQGAAQISQINLQLSQSERLGNQMSLDEIQSFRAEIQDWIDYCETHGLTEERGRIIDAMRDLMTVEARALQYAEDMAALHEELEAMGRELDALNPDLARIAAAEIEADRLERERIALTEGLSTSVQTLEDVANKILHSQERTITNIERYSDRHEQLKAAYGNAFLNTAADYSNGAVAWFMGHTLMSGTAIADAWRDPINLGDVELTQSIREWMAEHNFDEDEKIYRNNETGRLYVYDDGERHYVEDALVTLRLYEEAYASEPPRLFANETPYGDDPNNGYDETRAAMLEAAQLAAEIQAQGQSAHDQITSEIRAVVVDQPQGLDVVFGGLEETVSTTPRSAAPMEIDLNLGESFDATRPPPESENTDRENIAKTPAVGGIDPTTTGGQNGN